MLYIYRVVLLLLRLRRGAAGKSLGPKIKYLRRTTSGAAGSSPGTTANYLSGAEGIAMCTTTEYRILTRQRQQHTRLKQNTLRFMQKDTHLSQKCSGGHAKPNLTRLDNVYTRQGRRRPTPSFFAAGAGGVTTAETCVSAAAKLRLTNQTYHRNIAARVTFPLYR
jgi:hypothetical protein